MAENFCAQGFCHFRGFILRFHINNDNLVSEAFDRGNSLRQVLFLIQGIDDYGNLRHTLLYHLGGSIHKSIKASFYVSHQR